MSNFIFMYMNFVKISKLDRYIGVEEGWRPIRRHTIHCGAADIVSTVPPRNSISVPYLYGPVCQVTHWSYSHVSSIIWQILFKSTRLSSISKWLWIFFCYYSNKGWTMQVVSIANQIPNNQQHFNSIGYQ